MLFSPGLAWSLSNWQTIVYRAVSAIRIQIMNRLIPLAIAALLFSACSSERADSPLPVVEPPVVVETDPVDGINWFAGTVDEAFAAAAESGKPIYLYWGAEWCPPCHAISATVFKSPEFIERSQLFVPVYLDGDKENAQAAGERFGVRGYPTMIVFDSSGVELTRIPGGIDLEAYANVLDLTLSNTSSASQLTAALMAGEMQLSPAECTLLAYNSWGQDTSILVDLDQADAFRRMHSACPAGMQTERSILYLAWLENALNAVEAEEDPVPLSAEQRSEALTVVRSILANEELVKANVFNVLFEGARIAAALTVTGSAERMELVRDYDRAFKTLRSDDSVYMRERIYTLVGKMRFERIDDAEAELSGNLKREIRATSAWADESTPSVYERQPIINALANVLNEAGMDDVAKPLLLAELDRSKQAYYFMPDIADIERRAGNTELAIGWLQKAYEATRGPATRFQWGYYYLSGLLEMAPGDADRIRDTTVAMIRELHESGGFYQRPKRQLSSLQAELLAWGEANGTDSVLEEIRQAVLSICASAASPDESCQTFLERA